MERLLEDPKMIKHTLEYIKETDKLDTWNKKEIMSNTTNKNQRGQKRKMNKEDRK